MVKVIIGNAWGHLVPYLPGSGVGIQLAGGGSWGGNPQRARTMTSERAETSIIETWGN